MTTTALKLLALILMLIDHIGQFIPNTPIWFGWIGRISAPLFIFAVVWGFTYTSDRKKYVIRLYLFSLVVAFMNLTINLIYNEPFVALTNNFITPLFLIALILYIIEKKERKLYIAFGVWQVGCTVLVLLLDAFNIRFFYPGLFPDSYSELRYLVSLLGIVFFNEGGILFIILGVLLYLTKDDKVKLTIFYTGFSIFVYVLARKFGYERGGMMKHIVAFADYQWMMIAALPFMLLYNGKKGVGLKYLFYIFYPLHLAILYIIGQALK